MSQKCKLLKRAVQVKEQVSEAGVRRLQIMCSKKFCKFCNAVGLKVWNSIKKRLQQRCLPVKLAKFLKTPFLTEEFQWLLLTFNSCFQRSSERKPLRLPAINTRFSWKKVSPAVKIQRQPPWVFCKRRPARASTGVFLWILRNF